MKRIRNILREYFPPGEFLATQKVSAVTTLLAMLAATSGWACVHFDCCSTKIAVRTVAIFFILLAASEEACWIRRYLTREKLKKIDGKGEFRK